MGEQNNEGLAGMPARIREIREKANMTQTQFGNFLCLTQQQITKYENGKTFPKADILAKIAALGDVSLDWLIRGKEYESRFDANGSYSAQDIGLMFLALTKIYDLDVESHFTGTPSPLVTSSGKEGTIKEKDFRVTLKPNGNIDTNAICLRWLLARVFEYLGVISSINSSHKKNVYMNLLRRLLLTSGTERMESDTLTFDKEMSLAAWHKYDPIGIKDLALQEDDKRRLAELDKKVYPKIPERKLSKAEKEKFEEFLKWGEQLENEDSDTDDGTKSYSKD